MRYERRSRGGGPPGRTAPKPTRTPTQHNGPHWTDKDIHDHVTRAAEAGLWSL